MFKKIVIMFSLGFVLFVNSSFSINISIPNDQSQPDVAVLWSTNIERTESNLFDIINWINDYLWFGIWVICLWALVYGWFGLITSQWSEDKMKKANKILLWALVWILISILSYAIVRLVVNLI